MAPRRRAPPDASMARPSHHWPLHSMPRGQLGFHFAFSCLPCGSRALGAELDGSAPALSKMPLPVAFSTRDSQRSSSLPRHPVPRRLQWRLEGGTRGWRPQFRISTGRWTRAPVPLRLGATLPAGCPVSTQRRSCSSLWPRRRSGLSQKPSSALLGAPCGGRGRAWGGPPERLRANDSPRGRSCTPPPSHPPGHAEGQGT